MVTIRLTSSPRAGTNKCPTACFAHSASLKPPAKRRHAGLQNVSVTPQFWQLLAQITAQMCVSYGFRRPESRLLRCLFNDAVSTAIKQDHEGSRIWGEAVVVCLNSICWKSAAEDDKRHGNTRKMATTVTQSLPNRI